MTENGIFVLTLSLGKNDNRLSVHNIGPNGATSTREISRIRWDIGRRELDDAHELSGGATRLASLPREIQIIFTPVFPKAHTKSFESASFPSN